MLNRMQSIYQSRLAPPVFGGTFGLVTFVCGCVALVGFVNGTGTVAGMVVYSVASVEGCTVVGSVDSDGTTVVVGSLGSDGCVVDDEGIGAVV